MAMEPYYSDDLVTLYHGDCRDVSLPPVDVVVSDPPYPNKAGHFLDGIEAACEFMASYEAPRWFVFWHQLQTPPVSLPLVGRHIWHRTNTNRPDNYEAIYEFADEPERPSMVLPYPVVFPGLTGCVEATGHPTQKPERLMRKLLSLRKGVASVVDPFAGSGSTLVAAKWHGMTAVGVEIDESHCEDIAKRLAQDVFDFEGVA
jgi:DNA modification methylase